MGRGLFHFRHEGGTLPTRIEVGFHWSACVLVVGFLGGVLCLLLSTRQRKQFNQTPEKL